MLENLRFDRPIAFFDLETTGTSVKNDRIIEICIIKIYPDGKEEKILERVNPEIPIEAGASEVHGIYDEDVKDKPTFRELARKFYDFFLGTDIGGYNIRNFDLPLITKEFERVGMKSPFDIDTKIIDPMRIFHKIEKRDLATAYRFYCEKSLDNAHSAEADIKATIEVLQNQVEKYQLDNSSKAIADFCSYEDEKGCVDLACKFRKNDQDEIIFTFGSNKGKKVQDNLGMLKWMLDKDFSQDTKEHAKKLIEKFSKVTR
jgi:DNA polymerase-3 subunit epsilon